MEDYVLWLWFSEKDDGGSGGGGDVRRGSSGEANTVVSSFASFTIMSAMTVSG